MPAVQIQFGSVDLSHWAESWGEGFRPRIARTVLPRLHGAKIDTGKLENRVITVNGKVVATTANPLDLRTTFDDLKKRLQAGKQYLTLFDDRRILAQFSDLQYQYLPGSALATAAFTIEFISEEPFWEDVSASQNQRVISASPTTYTVSPTGSGFTKPKITIEANQGVAVTTAVLENLTNGSKITFTGNIAIGNSLVIDVEAGTWLNNGVDAIASLQGDLTTFLLDAGSNSLKYTGSLCRITLDYRNRHA